MWLRRLLLSAAASAAWATPPPAVAADAALPARVYAQDTVVVRASKTGSRLGDLAITGTILTRGEIRLGAARSVQDVLAPVPGVHLLDLSGSETGGAVEARGFAAQGSSSHMLVLVDEIPVNDYETGRVDWNLLAPAQVDHVEFLRGPVSFLHGSASMAGLVNLVTPGAAAGASWLEVGGGTQGRMSEAGGLAWGGSRAPGAVSLAHERVDGFRAHSRWDGTSFHGIARAGMGSRWGLSAHLLAHRGAQEVPGPLPDPEWRTNPRRAGTPLDHRDDRALEAALELKGALTPRVELTALGAADARHVDATETIIPVGTLDRTSRLGDGRGEVRVRWHRGSGGPDLLVGGEWRRGALASRYFDPGTRDVRGAGNVARTAGGVFVLGRAPLPGRVWFSAGARTDWTRSSLDDPTDAAPRGPPDDLRALSPMAGITRAWDGGHRAWLAYAGAFKAPELDQLYDRRPFDLGFGTFHISSHSLAPQRGDHWDAGGHVILGSRAWLDAAVYYARSRNEIGFDLARFRLDNIDRSRHAGLEAGLGTAPWRGVAGTLSGAWTRATFDGGPHDGRQINTVPENQLFARATWSPGAGGSVSLEVAHTGRQWLDEDDTVPLPDATVLNFAGRIDARTAEVFGTIRNLADRRYATLGYVTFDAGGNPLPLFFPAAGRSFALGVRYPVTRRER